MVSGNIREITFLKLGEFQEDLFLGFDRGFIIFEYTLFYLYNYSKSVEKIKKYKEQGKYDFLRDHHK